MTSENTQLADRYAQDVERIGRIGAVPRILEVVCRTTGMGFAAVARVTEDRWIACAVRDEIAFGLEPGGELDVKTTICDDVRANDRRVVIEHVASHDTYCRHDMPRMYGFQSYISVPLHLAGGTFFGTLCAFDPNPARIDTPQTIGMFELFADLIAFHLSAGEQIAAGERALMDERHNAELREQFIAVLGHDLRTPLGAIRAGAALLASTVSEPRARRAISVIQNSASRMAALIENVLDFARGRLGGGLPLTVEPVTEVDAMLDEVVAELRTVFPQRAIATSWNVASPIFCDRSRIAQLLSNLLSNALTHGDESAPVRVTASTAGGEFLLAVANAGPSIPPEKIERLFQPFARASEEAGRQGLGLGLYITSEIARAHGGSIEVDSSPDETRFTVRMPARSAPATPP